MIRWSCVRTSSLLGLRLDGLSAAERLALEDHLATCAACRETAALSDALRDLANAAPASLRQGAIERAVARGLEAATPPAAALGGRRWIWITGGLAATAAALVVVWATRSRVGPVVEVAPAPVPPAPAPAPTPPSEPPGDHRIRTQQPTEIALGRARLRAGAGSELSYDAGRETVTLSAGRVEVSVAPSAGRAFRVATARFVVEVVATRFSVSDDEVLVFEGRVRVLDLDGARLAELAAGEAWRPGGAEPTADRVPAAVRLARARRHLAARDVAGAKRELAAASAQRLARGQEAEAATLRAECAFVEGKVDEAVRLYLVVAERWPDLPAGESALFAAARHADRAGRIELARELLGRYLDRHPRGQFQREARARLRRLADGAR